MSRLFLTSHVNLMTQNPVLISDILTLSISFAIHYSAVSSALLERFLHLAMEVIYFVKENLSSMNLTAIENLTSNTLLTHVAESMKNEKKNDKI